MKFRLYSKVILYNQIWELLFLHNTCVRLEVAYVGNFLGMLVVHNGLKDYLGRLRSTSSTFVLFKALDGRVDLHRRVRLARRDLAFWTASHRLVDRSRLLLSSKITISCTIYAQSRKITRLALRVSTLPKACVIDFSLCISAVPDRECCIDIATPKCQPHAAVETHLLWNRVR